MFTLKDHTAVLNEIGCLICGRPPEKHHPRFCEGMSQRASDWLRVPLCAEHHRTNVFSEAIHNGKQEFEKKYGTEQELLAKTIQLTINKVLERRLV